MSKPEMGDLTSAAMSASIGSEEEKTSREEALRAQARATQLRAAAEKAEAVARNLERAADEARAAARESSALGVKIDELDVAATETEKAWKTAQTAAEKLRNVADEAQKRADRIKAVSGKGLADHKSGESDDPADNRRGNSPASTLDSSSEEELTRGRGASSKVDVSGEYMLRPERPRTAVGPQVDHSSAYVLFEELAYSACESSKRDQALIDLEKNFSCLDLDEKQTKSFQEILQEIATESQKCISRDQRKSLTRTLRGDNFIAEASRENPDLFDKMLMFAESLGESEKETIKKIKAGLSRISPVEDIGQIKELIKVGNRSILSSLVADLMDACLLGANKMQYASFPPEGVRAPRVPEEKNSDNGSKERNAKNALRVLSDFIQDIEEIKRLKTASKFPEMTRRIQDLEIDKALKEWGLTKDDIAKMIDGGRDIFSILREKGTLGNISKYMNDLFYYPWVDPKYMLAPDSSEWEAIMTQKKYNKGTEPRNNETDILYRVTARHVVLIFNCFKGLSEGFNKDQQEQIVKDFLRTVITEQTWYKSALDQRTFWQGLTSWASLNFSPGGAKYCKGSLMESKATENTKPTSTVRNKP